MPRARHAALALAVTVAAMLPLARVAWGGELEDLRAENRRLRARVETLEADNAKLKKTEAETAPLVQAMKTDAEAVVHVEEDGGTRLVTTDALRIDPTSGPHSRHWMWLSAKGAAPETVDFVVEGVVTGGAYRDAETLDLDVDGTTERLTVIRRTTESRSPARGNPGASGERVTAAMPRATLGRLARSTAARAKLGPTAFALGPEQLSAIRAFDARVGAATN